MSEFFLNLPKLRSDHNLGGSKESGLWLSSDKDLGVLARALPVVQEEAFPDQDEPIRAIPDPWAQATAFGAALCRMDHSLHKQSVSQWRGLLALMALREYYAGDFALSPMDVSLEGDGAFATVLKSLLPRAALGDNAALWRSPKLIMMAPGANASMAFAKPIAVTNPICFVSPGRTTAQVVVPKIDWAQGELKCPLTSGLPRLSAPKLSTLLHFLEQLHHLALSVSNSDGKNVDIATAISARLAEFMVDVNQELAATGRERIRGDLRANVQSNMPDFYKLLFNSFHLEQGKGSDLILASVPIARADSGEGPVKLKGFILADEAACTALGKDKSQILVWKNHSLADVLQSDEKLKEVRIDALSDGYMVLTIDDIMTRRAVKFGKLPKITGHPDKLQEMPLPLRPLSLLFLSRDPNLAADGGHMAEKSPSELIKERADGQVVGQRATFSFKLDLADGTTVTLIRHYAANPQGQEGLLVEDEEWEIYNCHVWPNFRSPSWRTYMARFLLSDISLNKMARPKQALSVPLLLDLIANAKSAADAESALRHCNDGGRLPDRLREKDFPMLKSARRSEAKGDELMHEEVQYCQYPFDAIFYTERFGETRAEEPVGLAFLALNKVADPTLSAKVAIDFGTTNTVGAFAPYEPNSTEGPSAERKANDAEPVHFKNRLVFPVANATEQTTAAGIKTFRHYFSGFIPPEDRTTPIPTVAKPKTVNQSGETLWAFRNLIYFHTNHDPAHGEESDELKAFMENTADAIFNLKWADDLATKNAATDFLTQFIVMTAAEMVAKKFDPARSYWHFSIPESMSATKRVEFSTKIRASLAAVGGNTDKHFLGKLQSEGLSAGNYMLHNKSFAPDRINIILDIGGGTTDITIWNKKKPVWKGSIYLAGGHFFTETLINNTDLLDTLGLGKWVMSLNGGTQEIVGNREAKKRQLAEMLFSGHSETEGGSSTLQRALQANWSSLTTVEFAALRHAALVYLAGIAWYTGLVTKYLSSGDNPVLSPDLIHDPAFAVCGRGGGLFALLHGSSEASDRTVVTEALSVYGRALGLSNADHPRFLASNAPKLEVVRGMLTQHEGIDTSADGMAGLGTILPLGLAVHSADGLHPADSVMDGTILANVAGGVDMDDFERFLAAVQKCTRIAIDIRMDKRENAERRIAAQTAEVLETAARKYAAARAEESRGGDGDDGVDLVPKAMEPPFLIALRELVALMAGPAERRQAVMTISEKAQ